MDYIKLKRQVLEKYFERTNEMQRKAIFQINGPVLIIAGAGSGKTTVLCNRIANMVLFGNAYNTDFTRELSAEDAKLAQDFIDGKVGKQEAAQRLSAIFAEEPIEPWRILAVTFTNKAAAELKQRLQAMGADIDGIWAATFHSACVKILRRDIEQLGLGYKSDFAIYDADDQLKLIKNIMKENSLSEKVIQPKAILNTISRSKDKLITPDSFSAAGKNGASDYALTCAKTVYEQYQKALAAANALDFDDIIMLTVRLFTQCPEVLSRWQSRFRYIMVDEYQDTNLAQYKLVSMLAGSNGNLCVVGDEDQSIYRFRGATIENILSFEKQYDARVIKLEQNYRSTANILKAANAVIANNTQHKEKNLWSDLGDGEKVKLCRFSTENEECMFVSNKILDGVKNGKPYSDFVVLYRNNAQSRNIETSLAKSGIPYRIIGGMRFFERKEIKDIIAYLCVINNPFDRMRFERIINEPVRGIGAATVGEINRVVEGLGMSYVQVLLESGDLPSLSKKAKILVPIGEAFEELSRDADELSGGMIIDEILDRFGYREALKHEGLEGEVRLDNINELKSMLITYLEENEDATLSGFLEQAALVSDMDSYENGEDKVVLMTMHSAKGLEFDTVFVVGTEENIFPGYRSQFDPMEIEEERRLAYVAITRAKRNLYLTCAKQRMLYGQTMRNKVSRFAAEIPAQYMEYSDSAQRAAVQKQTAYIDKKPKTDYIAKQQALYHAQKEKTEAIGFSAPVYSAGQRVRHDVFGEGTVISAKQMGNDQFLEIAFDTHGTKRVAAKFSKMKII